MVLPFLRQNQRRHALLQAKILAAPVEYLRVGAASDLPRIRVASGNVNRSWQVPNAVFDVDRTVHDYCIRQQERYS